MWSHRIYSVVVAFALVAVGGSGCEGTPSGEVSEAATWGANGGFMPFGGADGLCLGVVNNNIVAGAKLVSVTCNLADPKQGWRVSARKTGVYGGYQSISPQTNTSLCIDAGPYPFNGVQNPAVLAPCNGNSLGQMIVTKDGQLQPWEPYDSNHCLTVNGRTASGTPIVTTPCNGASAQTFWTFGIPTTVGYEPCLSTASWGQPVQTQSCSDQASTLPSSEVYFGTTDHTLMQRNSAYFPQCLTVSGYQGTYSQVSMQPCVYPVPTTQQWRSRLVPTGEPSPYSQYGVNIVSYSAPHHVVGNNLECLETPPGSTAGVDHCVQNSAQRFELLELAN